MAYKKSEIVCVLLTIGLAGCISTEKRSPDKGADSKKLAQAQGTVSMPSGISKEIGIHDFFTDEEIADMEALALSDDTSDTTVAWGDSEESTDFQKVYFKFNSKQVWTKEQKETVETNAAELKKALAQAEDRGDKAVVAVKGHACHSAGDREYNRMISEERAKAVADVLAANGVEREKMKIVGLGADCPETVDGETVTGSREEQEPNRRVELRVVCA